MKKHLCFIILIIFSISFSSFAADNLKDMFQKGSIKGEIRYRNFSRDYDISSKDRGDSAFGGLLYYKTDSMYGISFGTSFYTAIDVNSNNGKSVYGLLKVDENGDHDSYTKLGEYYINGHWHNTDIKIGAQEIFTPYLNVWNYRMSSNVFKGISIINKSITNLELHSYYITEFMNYNQTDYMPISKAFGAKGNNKKPVIIGGIKYTLPSSVIDKLTVQGWGYYMPDVYNLNYVRTDFKKKLNKDYTYDLRLSFLNQTDIGDELAGEFDSKHYGFTTGLEAYGLKFIVGYARTDDDIIRIQSDGIKIQLGHDLIIQQAPGASLRADEDAYLARIMYNFSHIGVKGLMAYIDHAFYDTPEHGENMSYDIHETDFHIQYAFNGTLDGLSLCARYALVDADEDYGGVDYGDMRFYITYKFAFSGK